MASKIFNPDHVKSACNALLAKGVRPTIGSVRQHLNIENGSNATLQNLIKQWYTEHTDKRIDAFKTGTTSNAPAEVPESVVELAKQFYRGIQQEARSQAANLIDCVKDDRLWIDQQLTTLVETREHFEAMLAQTREALQLAQSEVKSLKETEARLNYELESARKTAYDADKARQQALHTQQLLEQENHMLKQIEEMAYENHRVLLQQQQENHKRQHETIHQCVDSLIDELEEQPNNKVLLAVHKLLCGVLEDASPSNPLLQIDTNRGTN